MNISDSHTSLKPQLTLRVGITGHRHTSKTSEGFRYPQGERVRVGRQIKETLNFLADLAQSINSEFQIFYKESTPMLRFFSVLAEGADQEAVNIAIGRNQTVSGKKLSYNFEYILPFPKEKYIEDFLDLETRENFSGLLENEKLQSVLELAGPEDKESRPKAYEAARILMLENIDILIAVWDGKPGTRGGTCGIVEKAQAKGMPVVWIRADAEALPRFWYSECKLNNGFVPISGEVIGDNGTLEKEIRRLIAPPGEDEETGEKKGEAHSLLRKFFEDERPKGPGDRFYKRFSNFLVKERVPLPPTSEEELVANDWDRFFVLCPVLGQLKSQIESCLRSRHHTIDASAIYYADQYRSAYIKLFLLSGLAVSIGLCAIFWSDLTVKGICTTIELFLIFRITRILKSGKENRWHQKFLDARIIAEQLRRARFLVLAGRSGIGVRGSSVGETPSQRVAEWYVRSIFRELTIPNVSANPQYVKKVKNAMVKSELEGPNGQIYYNLKTHIELREISNWLHKMGEGLFWATIGVCGLYLFLVVLYWLNKYLNIVPEWYDHLVITLKNPFTFIAAVFPTFAAALNGIRYQGDFKASSKRSYATHEQLEKMRALLNDETRVPCLVAVGERFKSCADIMAHDVGGWRMIYAFRPLDNPG